jgi:hypothetical protein
MATIRSEFARKMLAGLNDMKRNLAIAAVAMMLGGAVPADAAPPTVTPSPGYDARLQEQRAVTTPYQPPARLLVHRRRVRHIHHDAH